jgi:hypothetical protein
MPRHGRHRHDRGSWGGKDSFCGLPAKFYRNKETHTTGKKKRDMKKGVPQLGAERPLCGSGGVYNRIQRQVG